MIARLRITSVIKLRQVNLRLTPRRSRAALPVAALAVCGCSAGSAATPAPTITATVAAPTPAPATPASPTTAATPPAGALVAHGPRSARIVALTFDADLTRGMRRLLDRGAVRSFHDAALFAELRRSRTPATIFLTGLWAQRYAHVVRRLARDPLFELENHSLDHAGFLAPCFGLPRVAADAAAKQAEITAARTIIERVAGVVPRYFRFPGGCHTAADVALVRALHERPVQWDVVSGDAFQRDPRVIVRSVLAQVRPGSIVIAHCVGAPNAPATAAAMRMIIPALRARGYRLVTLARLLGDQRRTP